MSSGISHSHPADTNLTVEQLHRDARLSQTVDYIFGDTSDPMTLVERRAMQMLSPREFIVWEGDAQTFQFGYVSASAETILGFPCVRWLNEPPFWCDTVVHPEDRNDAIAYCALATGQGKDHDFVYRARTADGRTLWLHDIVRVVKGARGIAERLRGIMLVIEPPAADMACPMDSTS
jgi:PAS domain-containing protein